MDSFRTEEQAERYEAFKATGGLEKHCILCEKPAIAQFTNWKITNNDFPYDRIAKTHHMIVPIRHIAENELSKEERDELLQIKTTHLQKNGYEFMLEAVKKSIPGHFHIHLIVGKK